METPDEKCPSPDALDSVVSQFKEATPASVPPQAPPAKEPRPVCLTTSQEELCEYLDFHMRLFLSGKLGLNFRWPLITSEGGCGVKTGVTEFCRRLEIPCFSKSAANWLPTGNRAGRSTKLELLRFCEETTLAVIHIHNLDQFTASRLSKDSWSNYVMGEIKTLLGGKIDCSYLDSISLLGNYMLVGSGHWGSDIMTLVSDDLITEEERATKALAPRIREQFTSEVFAMNRPSYEELRHIFVEHVKEMGGDGESLCNLDHYAKEIQNDGFAGIQRALYAVCRDRPLPDLATLCESAKLNHPRTALLSMKEAKDDAQVKEEKKE